MTGIKLPNNKAPHELSREELEEVLIKQAWRDETFRTELTVNPKAAIEKLLSMKIPSELKISVVQEVPNQMTLFLPQFPAAMGELSGSQLQAVTGGALALGSVACTCGCAGTGNCTVLCSWASRFNLVSNPADYTNPTFGTKTPTGF